MTIMDYIQTFSEIKQQPMIELYHYIVDHYPMLKEKISWEMPTFYKEHNIIHFAMQKNHLGIYPGSEAMEAFEIETQGYHRSKGAFQVTLNQKIPYDLIQKMIEYNLKKEEKNERNL